jgi:serine protease AprX
MIPKKLLKKIDPILLEARSANHSMTRNDIIRANDYERCKATLQEMGIKLKIELPFINAYAVEIPVNKLQDVAALQIVNYVSSNVNAHTQIDIACSAIGVDKLRARGYTGAGVSIAFIDTGISAHKDFMYPHSRIRYFKDFVHNRNVPYDDNGHGTFMSGVAAGNGYMSRGKYIGVAPKANIISLKAMDKDGGGDSMQILRAMQWIIDNKKFYNIRVVSISLGAFPKKVPSNDMLSVGAGAMWDAGLFVAAAAGNSGPVPGSITTPGVNPKVMTVGAVDDKRTVDKSDDVVADFSGRGPVGKMTKPDILAPGVDIVSTASFVTKNQKNGYTKMSGTSVATPIIAGAAALILQSNPKLRPDDIKNMLQKHAYPLTGIKNNEGAGIVQLS